jgi:hypothetical protein
MPEEQAIAAQLETLRRLPAQNPTTAPWSTIKPVPLRLLNRKNIDMILIFCYFINTYIYAGNLGNPKC